jgi:hypothetical protein
MTEENKALTSRPPGSLAPAPAYFGKEDRRGLEGTTQSDVNIPRLALAQALSPQVTDGDPNRIPELKVGDLFNSVTRQVYGREVYVQILRKMPLRAMEFNPIEDGGGVKDPNVPLDDPRLKWGKSGNKKEDKPKATLFRDFIGVILPQREIIALSFKSSGLTAAKTLWGLVIMRSRPVFAGRYRISSAVELQPKPHQVYKVENADWVSEADAIAGEQMYEAVQNISYEQIDRDAVREPSEDSGSFDETAAEM